MTIDSTEPFDVVRSLSTKEQEDLWLNRFGPDWVSETEIGDSFYSKLLTLMLIEGTMQSHCPAFSDNFSYKLKGVQCANSR